MFSEVISLHPPNIKLIFVTFAVLKCDKSNAVNELHRWNIPLIFVTCEESKCGSSYCKFSPDSPNTTGKNVTAQWNLKGEIVNTCTHTSCSPYLSLSSLFAQACATFQGQLLARPLAGDHICHGLGSQPKSRNHKIHGLGQFTRNTDSLYFI